MSKNHIILTKHNKQAGEVDWTFKEIVETLNLKSMTKSAVFTLEPLCEHFFITFYSIAGHERREYYY